MPYNKFKIKNLKLKIGEAGIAHLAVLLLLLAGIGLGTYLVQNRTQLFPQAECLKYEDDGSCSVEGPDGDDQRDQTDDGDQGDDMRECSDGSRVGPEEQCPEPQDNDQPGCSGPDCGEKINQVTEQIKNCRDGGGTWTGYECKPGTGTPLSQEETQKNIKCASDTVTYCDSGSAIRKTGGYFDPSKGQNGECVFDFFNVREKDSECDPAKGAFNGAVVSMTTEESKLVDQQRASGQRSSDSVCPSETVCKAGKRVIVYRTEKEGAPGCNQKEYPTESTQGCAGKAEGTKIAGDAQADTERKLYEQGQQRIDLKNEIDKARLAYDKDGKLDASDPLTAGFIRAQELLNTARTEYDKCFTAGGVKQDACTGTAEIANAQAVMAARLSLIEAAAKGVPNIRVKADLAVGGATNTLMEARPSTGGGSKSRVFLVTDSTGKKVNYVVLNAAGTFVPANAQDLKALGLSQNTDVSTVPTLFKDRIDKAQCAVDKTCPDTGAVTPRTGQTGNPPAVPANNSVSDNGSCTGTVQCKGSNQYGKSTCTGGVCKPAQAPVAPPQNITGKPNGTSCERGLECQTGFCNPVSPGARTGTCAASPATNRL